MERGPRTGHVLQVAGRLDEGKVAVTLLGPFAVSLGGKQAGPWLRPSARRLCELLMLRPDHRVGRDVVREMLFADLPPQASAHALSKALSMARKAVAALGVDRHRLLQTDRGHIYVPAEVPIEVDLVQHQDALRGALAMGPGLARDAALSAALAEDGTLLADEPYSDWALEARDRLELLRQRARLELARDRSNGHGWTQMDAVVDAWEMCLAHDLASEEAGISLMKAYAWRGERQQVVRTYRRCGRGLQELGLEPSSAMQKAFLSAVDDVGGRGATWPQMFSERPSNQRAGLRGPGGGGRLQVASINAV